MQCSQLKRVSDLQLCNKSHASVVNRGGKQKKNWRLMNGHGKWTCMQVILQTFFTNKEFLRGSAKGRTKKIVHPKQLRNEINIWSCQCPRNLHENESGLEIKTKTRIRPMFLNLTEFKG